MREVAGSNPVVPTIFRLGFPVRKRKTVGILLAVAFTFSVILFIWLDFRHLKIGLTPSQAGDIMIAIKGTMGQALFDGTPVPVISGAGGMDSLLAQRNPNGGPNQEDLIDAYRKDPAKFRHYADLFDTAMNGEQVGESIAHWQNGKPIPETSDKIDSLKPEYKLDAWGHAFCILDIGGRIAVVSGGPETNFSGCSVLFRSLIDDNSKRNMHQTSSGAVVVLVARKTQMPTG